MTTKNSEKKPPLSKIKRRLLSAAIIIFVPIIVFFAVALYETSGFGKYANVEASLMFKKGFPEIAHGGYFKLTYEGDVWTEDFGGGPTPKCNFYRIKLKRNRTAHIKVALKNGLGAVTWTKEEECYLTEGNHPVIIFADLEEIQ